MCRADQQLGMGHAILLPPDRPFGPAKNMKSPQANKHWRTAGIRIYGPVGYGYCGCRICGGRPTLWILAGVGEDGPRYWECEDCGTAEMVTGTPTAFGEPMISEEAWKKIEPKHLARYAEFRKMNGLPSLEPERKIYMKTSAEKPELSDMWLDFDGTPVDQQTRDLLTPMTDEQLLALAEAYNRRGREEISTVAFDTCHRIHRFINRRKADASRTSK